MPKIMPSGDVVVSVRLAPELIEWIDHHANANLRNRTQEIEYLVRLGLAEIQEQEKAGRQDLSLPTLSQIRDLVEKIKSKQ